MDERQKWPEASRFVDDFEIRLACAELMAELLMSYGRQVWTRFGDLQVAVVRTQVVDACDEMNDRFQQSLRVSECLYSYTNKRVSAGATHTVDSTEPLSDEGSVRVFALELGTLDLETVEESERTPEDYVWTSLAVAVIDIGGEDFLCKDDVTLVDAQDGTELTDDKVFELHGLLSALASELRASNFGDSTTLDEISSPEAEQYESDKYARPFRAIDFIEGVGCKECQSDHVVCAHNGSAN